MQRNPQFWITTGIALVGASLIAVTPVTTLRPDVQDRQFRLTDYDEFDLSQLVSTTEANWSGLETVLSSSNWLTDPDISQGLGALSEAAAPAGGRNRRRRPGAGSADRS
jgi:hypothetical protein